MALDRQIARLSKLLVDAEGVTFDEAQARLRRLTLEIVVGQDATTPAAHAAILTAVVIGRRSFLGGVRVAGLLDQPLNSALPLAAATLAEAVIEVGATKFTGSASQRISIGSGEAATGASIEAWWCGWRAGIGAAHRDSALGGHNPLVGIAAAALAVGAAFDAVRGLETFETEVDLWPTASGEAPPDFVEVFLPGSLWIVGLGNLGQAYLWALSALPFAEASSVSLVLQDRDRISEENWATSVLVHDETFGELKTAVGEAWAKLKGFEVRRVDRRLLPSDRLDDDDPRVALSGVDKVSVRRGMVNTGFECIVDAGLGRSAADFDRLRVSVFDAGRSIEAHFAEQDDHSANEGHLEDPAYAALAEEVGRCGTVEVAGSSIATPYVSTLAAAIVMSRLIAITSGCQFPNNEVRSPRSHRIGGIGKTIARAVAHGGRPRLKEP
jgi:hypothetical protein